MQRNNIKIKRNSDKTKWQCVSPNKIVLEEFEYFGDAIAWCDETFDFVRQTDFTEIENKIRELNTLRIMNEKPRVKRFWSGTANSLILDQENWHQIGESFINHKEFLGFLRGLVYMESILRFRY